MIKNIVFDLSRVLIEFDTIKYAKLAGVPDDDLELFRNCVYRSVPWLAMERGSISQDDAISEMCADLPAYLHKCVVMTVSAWWKQDLTPMPGMADLVRALKCGGYKIYLLSNARKCAHEYFPTIPGSEYFDGEVFSADIGQMKPQKEIFLFFYRQYSLIPSECFFIDDVTANVEAAIDTGMNGFVFRGDIKDLQRKMRSFGINI